MENEVARLKRVLAMEKKFTNSYIRRVHAMEKEINRLRLMAARLDPFDMNDKEKKWWIENVHKKVYPENY